MPVGNNRNFLTVPNACPESYVRGGGGRWGCGLFFYQFFLSPPLSSNKICTPNHLFLDPLSWFLFWMHVIWLLI